MQARGRLPTLGALAEQTKSSWARLIPTYDDVPPVYQDFFAPFRREGGAFPYVVLSPAYERFIHRTTEKLVCAFGQEVDVLEKSGNTFQVQCYPLAGISYVEVRTVLLDSHIQLCGSTRQGEPASSTFRFNSVGDYLFTPIVDRIRQAAIGDQDLVLSWEQERFEHLVWVNYKFMNYARRSLLPGEMVVHSIFQPEIRARVLTILGKTYYRTISPAHMIILTEGELIVIREEKRSGEDRYGGLWRYIPLNKIAALIPGEQDGRIRLAIHLPAGACLDCLFEIPLRPEVDRLLQQFGELSA